MVMNVGKVKSCYLEGLENASRRPGKGLGIISVENTFPQEGEL